MGTVFINFVQELQDYIIANSGFTPTLSAGVNFTIGNLLDVQDLELILRKKILLTLFEEGGTLLERGRRTQQERSFRFIFKGNYGQEAVDHCWRLLKWLLNKRTFQTNTFRVWLARADKLPTVFVANESGSHLADFVVTLNIFSLAEG